MARQFVDTNIFLRHILRDHPDHSPRSTAYLLRIERGLVQGYSTDTVVFETVFTLQRGYGHTRGEIRDALLPLLELAGLALPHKRMMRRVFDLYTGSNLSFADAYHAVLALQVGISEIVSFDGGFDRVPGVTRVEP
ncbi:MAG TPA: type II toxin-antitoxin system VapC family toxin [Dehalococcoidia bacterium]|nr:type II toxin-antitoxin system VapC family toxin [Dehalococcoidia bacterium]